MSFPSSTPTSQAIVIGASAGGLLALSSILELLPREYPVPIIIVQHRAKDPRDLLEEVLQNKVDLQLKQADEKEMIKPGIYIAPPDYHLMIENDKTFSLSSDKPVQFSRPSIDVLFETAAQAYKERLVGILLTGSNKDGMSGMCSIRQMGGITIAQSPKEAEYPAMPSSAIEAGCADRIMTLEDISTFLLHLPATLRT